MNENAKNQGMERHCIAVTGASRGIGAAIALSLAEQGWHVACLSRSGALPGLAGIPEEVAARWIGVTADVTQPAALAGAFDQLVEAGWHVKGLVNNAGVHLDAVSAEMPLEQWRQVMDTNATSVVSACQAAYPHLVAANGGVIVNIGSFFDKLGVKRNLAYCASKAAVGAITRVLAVEWAPKGIRVIERGARLHHDRPQCGRDGTRRAAADVSGQADSRKGARHFARRWCLGGSAVHACRLVLERGNHLRGWWPGDRALTSSNMNLLERLDARLPLNDEERMLLDSVRKLAREQIAPRAEHHDRTCRVPVGACAGDQRAGPERHVHTRRPTAVRPCRTRPT